MKINFATTIKGLDGKPIAETTDEGSPPVTLGVIVVNALLGAMKGDEAMSGEDKFRLYQIAEKVSDSREGNKEIDLPVEDVSRIKERIGKMYAPAIVGPAFKLIN